MKPDDVLAELKGAAFTTRAGFLAVPYLMVEDAFMSLQNAMPLALRPPPELGEIVDRMGAQKSKDWSASDIRVLLGFAAMHAGHAAMNTSLGGRSD